MKRVGFLACALTLLACVGDDSGSDAGPDTGAADTGSDVVPADAVTKDVVDAASVRCDPAKAFDSPTLVTELNTTGSAEGLRLSSDGLTAYYGAEEVGADAGVLSSNQIYKATRVSVAAAFGSSVPLPSIHVTGFNDGLPTVTADGLTMFFHSTRPGGQGSNDLYVTTRTSTLADFGGVQPLQGVNTSASETGAYVLPDGSELYYGTTAGPNGHQIMKVTKAGSGFSTPIAVTELSDYDDYNPVVSPDDLVIYYLSTRTDGGAKGGADVWVATRSSNTDTFGSARNVAEVNTADADGPSYISADLCTLYFYRDVANDAGILTSRTCLASLES